MKNPKPPAIDVYSVRRANLSLLVLQHKSRKNLGEALGYTNGSYISQLLSDPPKRRMTETVARSIEGKLHLAAGWMDMARVGA